MLGVSIRAKEWRATDGKPSSPPATPIANSTLINTFIC